MNSVHDNNKKWQPPLQSPSLTDPPSTPSQPIFPSTPMEHAYPPNFPSGPLDSPIHQTFPQHSQPSTYFTAKHESSDPRLPGMMGMSSQPGTPQPSSLQHQQEEEQDALLSPTTKKQRSASYATAFSAGPYSHPSLMRKQRGSRSEPLFTTEMGPIFSSTKSLENIYALDRSTLLPARIQAKMDRGFFLADNDWTCYRRNYFQVSCAFSVPGLNTLPTPPPYYGADPHHSHHPHHPHHHGMHQEPQCYVQADGMFLPVRHFSLNISARVSNSDKKIDLVQHTPKLGASQNIATFERIQFKTATANNGKRRAAQQYYVCVVDLYCDTVMDGMHRQIKVASCQSAPLVVRGRSPGHYSDNQQQQQQALMGTSPTDPTHSGMPPRFDLPPHHPHHPHAHSHHHQQQQHPMALSQQPSLPSHIDQHRYSPSPSPFPRPAPNGMMVNHGNGAPMPHSDYGSYPPGYPSYPGGGAYSSYPGPPPPPMMLNSGPSSPLASVHPPHSSVAYPAESSPAHPQQQQQHQQPHHPHPYMVADMPDQSHSHPHAQQQQQHQHSHSASASSTAPSSTNFYRNDMNAPLQHAAMPPHPQNPQDAAAAAAAASTTSDWRRYSTMPPPTTPTSSSSSSSAHTGMLPPLSTPNGQSHVKNGTVSTPSTPNSNYDQSSYFQPPLTPVSAPPVQK
ncbi:hypothetical protein BCR42DRAFT_417156 [Absidia repens]|uniref:NDT80 domain-containing protein n=1 Tax=Absidia repens TaxID=90262 RepID=A0A1X2IDG2_9FUNG|nr:hypothetical protein BCR42DRAFT_417156 [Absidia repens]